MSSVVSMLVGQCGNTVGASAYSILHEQRPFLCDRSLFDESGRARAVMVDGEAKVVGALVKHGDGPFNRANAFFEDSGRGNNWALGYYGPRGGNSIVDHSMEAFRRELEASDAYRGGVVFHSLCGGTGAGLGSRIMEEMRDELAMSPLISTTVLPFSVGELPLQHYNATLCLSRLIKETDACFLFSNSDILSLCSKRNANKTGSAVRPLDAAAAMVKTAHINRYIGLALASVMRPCMYSRKRAAAWDMSASIAALAPTKETKFVEIWSVQESCKLHPSTSSNRRLSHYSSPPWATLGERLGGEVGRFITTDENNTQTSYSTNITSPENTSKIRKIVTGAYQVFARGPSVQGGEGREEAEGAVGARKGVNKCLDLAPCVQDLHGAHGSSVSCSNSEHFSNSRTACAWICCPQPLTRQHPRSLTLVASRSGHLAQVARMHERCGRMFAARAYLHWFKKFGFEDDEMQEALEDVRHYLDDAQDFFNSHVSSKACA